MSEIAALGSDATLDQAFLDSLSIGALLYQPVLVGGQIYGYLGFNQFSSGRVWGDREYSALTASSDLFALALERQQTYGRLGFHVSNAPLGVLEWDGNLRITRWSPKAEVIFGWTAAEVIGRNWSDWQLVHEDDAEAVADITDRLVAGDDLSNVLTNRNYTKSGDVITCEWFNSVLRDREGKVVSILSFVQDVTQIQRYQESLTSSRGELEQRNAHLEERVVQRTAELEAVTEDSDETAERLRLIQSAVDQIDESVTITDNQIEAPGPHIVYVNPAFTAMTGYSSEEALALTPRVLQGPRTDRAVIARLRRCLTQGRHFFGQAINYRKDGSEYFVEWHVNPVRDANGKITHWVAIQRDITKRKLADDLARVHREELAHVTRLSAMGEMASGIAHEINQPLAAINNYASGALRHIDRDQATVDDLAEAIRQVADQSDRAGQIIRRLRAFVTKRGTRRATHHINELIHETIALLETDIFKHRTQVELDLAPNDQLSPVHVDGIQIEQVLVNLARNAFEAMDDNPPHERKLKLSARPGTANNIEITVSDQGPGLTPSQRDYLFDPFFTTKDEGMGMGLTISQSIVQDHGGRLRAAPNPEGPGTSFHLTLPAANP
ncbi:MAG: PAS domain S-box protein [Planctomycetota bacterium]